MIPVNQITILFVDDEPDILNSLRRFLKREEYKMEFANSGIEAVERLKLGDIDILVTDMQMPKMNGMEVIQHVREYYPSIVRMVLSANTDFEQTMTNLNSGEIFRYILKPLNPKLFRCIMDDAVEYYRMVRLCQQVNAGTSISPDMPQPPSRNRAERKLPKSSHQAGSATSQSPRQVAQSEREIEQMVRAEFLQFEQSGHNPAIEGTTITAPEPAGNTVFSDCLITAPDRLEIVFGNVITDTNNSPLLGTAFKNVIFKSLLQTSCLHAEKSPALSGSINDLGNLVAVIDRAVLPKLRNLNLSMNLLYTRYGNNYFEYVSCGKVNLLHYQAETGSYTVQKGGNPPLGVLEGTEHNCRSLSLAAGDILMLYLHTPLPENGPSQGQISDTKIAEAVQKFAENSDNHPLEELRQRLLNFTEKGEQDCWLNCLALRVPQLAADSEPTVVTGREGRTKRYHNA